MLSSLRAFVVMWSCLHLWPFCIPEFRLHIPGFIFSSSASCHPVFVLLSVVHIFFILFFHVVILLYSWHALFIPLSSNHRVFIFKSVCLLDLAFLSLCLLPNCFPGILQFSLFPLLSSSCLPVMPSSCYLVFTLLVFLAYCHPPLVTLPSLRRHSVFLSSYHQPPVLLSLTSSLPSTLSSPS